MSWPRPKRILMTADTIGGVWTYAIELCGALAEVDIEVVLATMGREPSRAQIAQVAALGNTELYGSEFALEWMSEPWEDVARSCKWLLKIAERTRPDLVHLNTFAHGALDFGAPTVVVGHSCVFSWWKAVHGTRPPAEWVTYQSAVARGLRRANFVIAPSFAMMQALQRYYGPLENCEVIPNGIAPSEEGAAIKEPLILSAGRLWDEAKNIALLASISNELAWPVYVAGDCGDSEFPNLRCLGELARSEVRQWQQRAAIYAAPAKYEPFGLSILEAADAGCALVLGDIPSLRENWDGAALFIDARDPRRWKEILNELARNASRRRELAVAARKRAGEFTLDRMVNAYLSAYADTLLAKIPAAIA